MKRRSFLHRSALLSAAVMSSQCRRPANERINLGVIGCGYMGTRNLEGFLRDERLQVTALCDVNAESAGYWRDEVFGREPARRLVDSFYAKAWNKPSGVTGKSANAYSDYREMLAKEDLDAVLVATPDHWHALQSIEAMRAGVHVYCQKPLALTVHEGRAIAEVVKETGMVFQTGSQQRSDQHIRRACELVRAGAIGKVHTVKVGIRGGHPNYSRHAKEIDPAPVPAGLDYDLWLGPAPEAPYCPARLHANWRWIYDYSGGNITDWGAHHIDSAHWGLNADATGPVKIENIEGEVPDASSFYNTAKTYRFECVHADGTRVIVGENEKYGFRGGIIFEGEDGAWIHCDRGDLETSPGSVRGSEIPESAKLVVSKDHERNFIDAILEGAEIVAPVEAAHRTATVCHLANIALRLGRTELAWDPVAESVLGDAEAEAMLGQPMRAPWSL